MDVGAGLRLVENAVVSESFVDQKANALAGAVYDGAGLLVTESRRPDFGVWTYRDEARIVPAAGGERMAQGLFLGHFFSHFGHFLTETLPQLIYAVEHDLPLIWHPWPHTGAVEHVVRIPHVRFMLDAFGVADERIRFCGPSVSVDTLFLAPRFIPSEGRRSALPLRKVFERVVRHARMAGSPAAERVYFSRRRFAGRARLVENEQDVEQEFASRGFSIVYPETLGIGEQVAIAAAATDIAGIDGSALHLAACMKPKGRCFVVTTRGKHSGIGGWNELCDIDTIWLDHAKTWSEQGSLHASIDIGKLSASLDERVPSVG